MHNLLDQFINGIGIVFAMQLERGDEQKMVWLYRLVITALLTILGTFFVAERFLPYPWLQDGPMVKARITVLEQSRLSVAADVKEIKSDLREVKTILMSEHKL